MIVDAHNDLLTELVFRSPEERPFTDHWRVQLEQAGVGLTVCAVYPPDELRADGGLRAALLQIAACHRAAAEQPDSTVLVTRRDDLAGLDPKRRLGLLLSLEGAEPVGRDLAIVDVLWGLGIRMVGLTWNTRNQFADGAGEPDGAGLSKLGRALVNRLVEVGAVLDLAHASERTFYEVLERVPRGGAVVSHAACRALRDTPRNLDDAQLRALAEHGGVLGVMALPLAVDVEQPTIARYVDHVEHALATMGAGHVGIGADFIRQVVRSGAIPSPNPGAALMPAGMELDAAIEGLEGPAGFPAVVAELRARGLDGLELDGVLGGNFLQFLAATLP